MSGPDHLVIDWRDSMPAGVDGLYLVSGMTVEQFQTFANAHPELVGDELIAAVKASGCDVTYVPVPISGEVRMEERYDCTVDVLTHKQMVEYWMRNFWRELQARSSVHDNSKLQEPEKSIFDLYTWRLKNTIFGSPEYQAQLVGMGEGLKHHYANNSHHPEHFENGIAGMSLPDLVEMFCDWQAAAERHGKPIDLDYLTHRFKIEPQLAQIILNTIKDDDIWNKVVGGWDRTSAA